jgi:predicted enzyme related to lactoylglutathione lyase
MPDYAPGTPIWVELNTPDADAAASFYSELFGWNAADADEDTGGYRMFQQGEASVAGMMPHQEENQPTAWLGYVLVEDADATAEAVQEAGGTTIVEPMDVMEIGRMAFFTDPAGAAFGVWQAKSFTGADKFNEPVSLTWNELATRDPEGAKEFYSAVFGWKAGDGPTGSDDPYVVWELDGKPVGGMMPMGDNMPDEMPAYWGVCFAVADADEIVKKAEELDGSVTHPATDMPIGRFAVLSDPQGAAFAIMQFAEQG